MVECNTAVMQHGRLQPVARASAFCTAQETFVPPLRAVNMINDFMFY